MRMMQERKGNLKAARPEGSRPQSMGIAQVAQK